MSDDGYRVLRTADRECRNDYQVQLSPEQLHAGPFGGDGDLVEVSNLDGTLAVYARMYGHEGLSDDEAGVDFSLRYALGVTAEEDVEHGAGEAGDRVRIEPAAKADRGRIRGFFDWLLGVRTEICRVRMAVHPDLENNVCRIPETTMELVGIEEGDSVVVESTEGRVDGIKALVLDEDVRERKDRQRERQPRRYVDCYEKLDLQRIRATGEDLPEIFLDAEVRRGLGITDDDQGVCHPVRVHRDTVNVLVRHLHTFVAPLVFVLVGAAIRVPSVGFSVALFSLAALLGTFVLIYQGRRLLR